MSDKSLSSTLVFPQRVYSPVFMKCRSLAFGGIAFFSLLWIILLCVVAAMYWEDLDQPQQSFLATMLLLNTFTIMIMILLIIRRFRDWLDAARVFLTLIGHGGVAGAYAYWAPSFKCRQAGSDAGICTTRILFTLATTWVIPALLSIYALCLAVTYIRLRKQQKAAPVLEKKISLDLEKNDASTFQARDFAELGKFPTPVHARFSSLPSESSTLTVPPMTHQRHGSGGRHLDVEPQRRSMSSTNPSHYSQQSFDLTSNPRPAATHSRSLTEHVGLPPALIPGQTSNTPVPQRRSLPATPAGPSRVSVPPPALQPSHAANRNSASQNSRIPRRPPPIQTSNISHPMPLGSSAIGVLPGPTTPTNYQSYSHRKPAPSPIDVGLGLPTATPFQTQQEQRRQSLQRQQRQSQELQERNMHYSNLFRQPRRASASANSTTIAAPSSSLPAPITPLNALNAPNTPRSRSASRAGLVSTPVIGFAQEVPAPPLPSPWAGQARGDGQWNDDSVVGSRKIQGATRSGRASVNPYLTHGNGRDEEQTMQTGSPSSLEYLRGPSPEPGPRPSARLSKPSRASRNPTM